MLKSTLKKVIVSAALASLLATGAFASQKHTVAAGDTVSSVAAKYNVTTEAVLSANKMSADDILNIGKVLIIPAFGRSGNVTNKSRAAMVTVHTNTENVILRKGPSKSSEKAAVLAKFVDCRVIERVNDDWAKVSVGGTTGYIFRDLLSSGPAPEYDSADSKEKVHEKSAAEKSVSKSRNVVGTALSCRGSRYRRGGTGKGGFDCSGFTSYVFAQHGIKLPRTSAGQSRVGTPVSKSDLQPGDLVFFNTRGRGVSHVAIYIGNGNIVHASSVRTGVKVDSLSSAYYKSRYHSARRVK